MKHGYKRGRHESRCRGPPWTSTSAYFIVNTTKLKKKTFQLKSANVGLDPGRHFIKQSYFHGSHKSM